MMVTVDAKVGEPGEEADEEQESDEEGVNPLTSVQWRREGEDHK